MSDDSLTFDDYNRICTDCTEHDKCHKNREINWNKLDGCKNEITDIIKEGFETTGIPKVFVREMVVFT